MGCIVHATRAHAASTDLHARQITCRLHRQLRSSKQSICSAVCNATYRVVFRVATLSMPPDRTATVAAAHGIYACFHVRLFRGPGGVCDENEVAPFR